MTDYTAWDLNCKYNSRTWNDRNKKLKTKFRRKARKNLKKEIEQEYKNERKMERH